MNKNLEKFGKNDFQKFADELRRHIEEANDLAKNLSKAGYEIQIDFKNCRDFVRLPDDRISIEIFKETIDKDEL